MNNDELQQQYALDTLLHPEGKPWEWWECSHIEIGYWEPLPRHPAWSWQYVYRRKSTAPDWSQELSPKEVAKCDDWTEGYKRSADRTCKGSICITIGNNVVWWERGGFDCSTKQKKDILTHFQKRREAALATYGNTKDNPLSKDEILRDEAIARFTEKATSKFNAGIQEHNPNGGNDLEDRATFADLEDEIIDLWYYVQGLKRRICNGEAYPESGAADGCGFCGGRGRVIQTGMARASHKIPCPDCNAQADS